mgnify:CR=1 FL=1
MNFAPSPWPSSALTTGSDRIDDAVLAACRGFAGGDLPDDCAIVVIQRLA